MAQLTDQGITVEVPNGWEVDFYRRTPDAIALSNTKPESTYTVVHLANWPLPAERGDFGGGAVELMRRSDLLIILFEYGPEHVGSALFASEGVPWPLDPDAFAANQMQRPLPGQGGLQQFFTVSRRPFCLYVVLGSLSDADSLVAEANEVLAGVSIA